MMKLLFYILLISLNISCNGQEKSVMTEKEPSKNSALKSYQKQKQQLEFNTFKMLYNGKTIKLGTVANFSEIVGKPDYIYYGNLIYSTLSINPTAHIKQKLDNHNQPLILVGNDEIPLRDKKGNAIEKNFDLFIENGSVIAPVIDKNGTIVGDIYTYRIWMSPYKTASIVPDKPSNAMAKIPALNGYIKINGKLIHQSITKKELVKQLQPLPAGGQIVGMLGDPVLIYDLGEKGKDFDPNIDPQDSRVFIDFVFKTDPVTKEEKGLYYINYYYSLKPKEKAKK